MERLGETVAIVLLQMYYRFHVKALSPELQTTMKEHFDECQNKKSHIVEETVFHFREAVHTAKTAPC